MSAIFSVSGMARAENVKNMVLNKYIQRHNDKVKRLNSADKKCINVKLLGIVKYFIHKIVSR